jgi:hypothetical protein
MEKFSMKIIGKAMEFGNIDVLDDFKFCNNKSFPNSYKNLLKNMVMD